MRNLGTTPRCLRLGLFPGIVLGCALAILPTAATGCKSMPNPLVGEKKKTPDPILGEVHPQNSAPYGPVPPPPDRTKMSADPTSGKTSLQVPPPPLAPSANSNAYLASMTKPLPGSQPLAITDGQPGSLQLAANNEPVVRPIPRDPAFVNSSWVAPPTSATSGSSGPGQFVSQPGNFVDPQTEILKARGITQHRVDPQPDGSIRLIAVAPQPGNPNQVRTYDVNARDLPAAVQALVQQMDQGR